MSFLGHEAGEWGEPIPPVCHQCGERHYPETPCPDEGPFVDDLGEDLLFDLDDGPESSMEPEPGPGSPSLPAWLYEQFLNPPPN